MLNNVLGNPVIGRAGIETQIYLIPKSAILCAPRARGMACVRERNTCERARESLNVMLKVCIVIHRVPCPEQCCRKNSLICL